VSKKTLLLTGGAGFIGHHTVEHILKNTDWNIVVLDNLNYAGNLNYINDILVMEKEEYVSRVSFVFDNIQSPISDLNLKAIGDIDYVIHMAAESHVDNSIKDPTPFVMSNVVGTMNVLDACKKLNPEKIIQISTDEVYGPSINGHLHKEGEPHKPGNPYSASKAGAEDLALAYYNTYRLPVLITNTMNNFGERQNPEKFLPKTMISILKRLPCIAHCKKDESGKVVDISSRCWLHARNHADALLYLLLHGVPGEKYNVTGDLLNVAEMINFIASYMGYLPGDYSIAYEDFHSFRLGHDMHYGLDGTKLKNMGWFPKVEFHESLQRTVEWTMNRKNWLGL
jgi:dTDP-glucose 4,6-dehydratase